VQRYDPPHEPLLPLVTSNSEPVLAYGYCSGYAFAAGGVAIA
jgi:hypothetical protein